MRNGSFSLLYIDVIRFYNGSTNVDSVLTFNSNTQGLSVSSLKAAINGRSASTQTDLGLTFSSVDPVFLNNPATTVSPIQNDGKIITSSNILFLIIISLISILF